MFHTELDRIRQQQIIVLPEKCLLLYFASKLPSILMCANTEAIWESCYLQDNFIFGLVISQRHRHHFLAFEMMIFINTSRFISNGNNLVDG